MQWRKQMWRLLAALAVLNVGALWAQDGGSLFDTPSTFDTPTTETEPEPEPTSTSDYSFSSTPDPMSASSGSGKTAPRTQSYGSVMQANAAVDFTTADYIFRPHLIGDLQFVSGNAALPATEQGGAFAFRGMGFNWFGSVVNNARTVNAAPFTNSRVRFGMGMGETFGAGLMLEFNKFDQETVAGGVTTTNERTEVGDAYGIFGSVNLGFINIFGDINRETSPFPTVSAAADDESVTNNILVGAMMDTKGEGSHALGGALIMSQSSYDLESTGADGSSMSAALAVFHGVPLVYNDDFGVFMGSNSLFSYSSEEQNTPANVDGSGFEIMISPNMGVQKKLGKGFEGTMGGSVNLINYQSETTDDTVTETDLSVLNMEFPGSSGSGDLGFGLRWTKGNFAVEGELATAFLLNGPNFIGGGTGLFGSVGVAAGF